MLQLPILSTQFLNPGYDPATWIACLGYDYHFSLKYFEKEECFGQTEIPKVIQALQERLGKNQCVDKKNNVFQTKVHFLEYLKKKC